MKYFLLGFATAVFLCVTFVVILPAILAGVISVAIGPPQPSEHTLTTLQERVSPDGSYVATSYRDMGGGAAGWCAVEVNVRPVGQELPPNESVFISDCETMVDISWESNRNLTVTFTPNSKAFSVTQAATNKDGSVRIKYVQGKLSPAVENP